MRKHNSMEKHSTLFSSETCNVATTNLLVLAQLHAFLNASLHSSRLRQNEQYGITAEPPILSCVLRIWLWLEALWHLGAKQGPQNWSYLSRCIVLVHFGRPFLGGSMDLEPISSNPSYQLNINHLIPSTSYPMKGWISNQAMFFFFSSRDAHLWHFRCLWDRNAWIVGCETWDGSSPMGITWKTRGKMW